MIGAAAPKFSVTSVKPATAAPASPAPARLSPVFRVELRRRHSESAPVEVVEIPARTMASARHAARLAHPETVILSITRL